MQAASLRQAYYICSRGQGPARAATNGWNALI
jgi:hypothetical protein